MQARFVVLGDTHFPFHDQIALSHALDIIKLLKPKYVVQVGDLYDLWSMSRFAKAQNQIGMTPAQELQEARQCAEQMWSIVQKYSKKSKCIQLAGNHDIRFKSALINGAPELFGTSLVDFEKPFKFKGVKTYFDHREEVVIDGITFMHFFYNNLSQHCRTNMMSSVGGHTHKGGTYFTRIKNVQPLFELNAGYLGRQDAEVFKFTKQKWTNWTKGIGIIWDYLGRLHPMFMQLDGIKRKRK